MCEWCGTYVAPGSTFCSGCGRALRQGDQGTQGSWEGLPPPPTGHWQGQPYPPYPATNPGNGFSIGGIICGVVAFLFCPILLGPIGMILAGVAISHKERLGQTAMVVSALGLVVGMLLGFLVFNAQYG